MRQVIITVRHGHYDNRVQDPFRQPLSRDGVSQATNAQTELIGVLKEFGTSLGFCISSDMQRAVQTAEIITERLLEPSNIRAMAEARERSLGVLNPRDMGRDERFKGAQRSALTWRPPEGESLQDLVEGRLKKVMEQVECWQQGLAKNSATGAILISAHGGVNHALLHMLTGMSDRQLTHGPLVSGSRERALQNPGYIRNGQLHVYWREVGERYYRVRTVCGSPPAFKTPEIIVERR